VSHFLNVACQKLLKLANVHGAIEKIIVASFMDQSTLKVILFFNSPLASSKNKEYLTV